MIIPNVPFWWCRNWNSVRAELFCTRIEHYSEKLILVITLKTKVLRNLALIQNSRLNSIYNLVMLCKHWKLIMVAGELCTSSTVPYLTTMKVLINGVRKSGENNRPHYVVKTLSLFCDQNYIYKRNLRGIRHRCTFFCLRVLTDWILGRKGYLKKASNITITPSWQR